MHGDKLFDIAIIQKLTPTKFCSINLYTLQPRSMTISLKTLLNLSTNFCLVKYLMQLRCNEFLRSIGKLSCIENSKVIDGSVSLRDELKVYALKKIIN